MSYAYDWDRVAHRLREHLGSEGMPRVDFAGRARVGVIDLDRLLTGMSVPDVVLTSIETNTGLSFADLRLESAPEPARFDVPRAPAPEDLRGAFTMHRWSFDHPDRIVRSRLEFTDCAQTGRRRFASQQRNRALDGLAHAYDHAGFVWPGTRSGISQLVGEDEGILRIITLAMPVRHNDPEHGRHVTVNGTLQTVAEQGDVGHYPAITPVVLDACHSTGSEEDALGSYSYSDPSMAEPRPPLKQSVAERLMALGPRVLPALSATQAPIRGPRPVAPLAG